MSEFSDRPLVAGSLTGLRAFGVDNLGRLHGPSVNQVFRPGENVAECRKSDTAWMTAAGMPVTAGFYRTLMGGNPFVTMPIEVTAEVEPKPVEKPKHTAGIMDCTCGFYAYFDGRNNYKKPDRVAALVEGYGVCTVGSRGFRSEKAKLVALIVPGPKFPEPRFQLVLRNYPDVPVYASKGAALADHPLTVPDVPGPDSPGFWDRPVTS